MAASNGLPYFLTRTPDQPKSNTEGPSSRNVYQFIELTYTSTGAKDSIFLPDVFSPVGVTISGSGVYSATLEATDSPPDVVLAGTAVWYSWPAGAVAATTSSTVSAATALRVNIAVAGTNVVISAKA